MRDRMVWLFSGQGSQYYHMGSDLYDTHPVFRHWMDTFDAIGLDKTGVSLLDVLYDPRRDLTHIFDALWASHPTLFMVQYSLAMALWEEGLRPDLVLGASLGEFVAAAVGGAVEPEPLFEALLKQARRVEAVCPEGGMLATLESPDFFRGHPALFDGLELASVNFDRHFVVAGMKNAVNAAEKNLAARGIFCLRLPVLHGFHSSAIDPAREHFLEVLAPLAFGESHTPLLSCLTGGILARPSAPFYWDVVRRTSDFRAAFRALEDDLHTVYLDVGPSGTLANFVKYLSPATKTRVHSILSPFGDNRRRYDRVLHELKGGQFHDDVCVSRTGVTV